MIDFLVSTSKIPFPQVHRKSIVSPDQYYPSVGRPVGRLSCRSVVPSVGCPVCRSSHPWSRRLSRRPGLLPIHFQSGSFCAASVSPVKVYVHKSIDMSCCSSEIGVNFGGGCRHYVDMWTMRYSRFYVACYVVSKFLQRRGSGSISHPSYVFCIHIPPQGVRDTAKRS